MTIRSLVEQFAAHLGSLIEREVLDRARTVVDGALRKGGSGGGATTRKKPPRQLCPVPGCKHAAAPVYGMVCAEHKNVPKRKIKKYREERRAKKLKAAA